MSVQACRFCLDNHLLSEPPVGRTGHFYVLMSNDPALTEAAMVIPHRHGLSPFDMEPAEWADLPNALNLARQQLERFAPHGFNIGWNVGAWPDNMSFIPICM